MKRPPPPPDECANCGADIPRNARACPECGADERTGWRETSVYDGLDLPDDETSNETVPAGRKTPNVFWLIICAALLAVLILGALGLRL